MRGTATELVVWDFDGTVADTFDAIIGSASEAFASLGIAPNTALLRASIGLPLAEMFRVVLDDPEDAMLEQLARVYRSDFAVHGTNRSRLFPGIADLLGELAGSGTRLALATSRRRRSLEPLLDAFGLHAYLDLTVTDDEVQRPKPHPEMLLMVCAVTGVEPSAALMIGDTTYDMEMGRRAGATTCAVTWGNHERDLLIASGADHVVDSVVELRGLLAD